MKLEDIYEQWKTDAIIDNENLINESLKIPHLHAKYLKYFTSEKIILTSKQSEYKELYKNKHEYYANTMDIDEIKELGWEPLQKKIMKADVPMHIDADKEIKELRLKVAIQKEKVEALDHIIKSLNNRGFYIKNAVDYMRFINGG